jgi:hypothetical protein
VEGVDVSRCPICDVEVSARRVYCSPKHRRAAEFAERRRRRTPGRIACELRRARARLEFLAVLPSGSTSVIDARRQVGGLEAELNELEISNDLNEEAGTWRLG